MDNSCTGTLIIIAIIILFVLYSQSQARKRRKEAISKARKAYQDSLSRLKQDPDSANLRQHTLELGRKYARLVREEGNETLFDEVALMNDLNAIIGTRVAKSAVAKSNAEGSTREQLSSPSLKERLKALEELRAEGLITDEEYVSRRKALLDSV